MLVFNFAIVTRIQYFQELFVVWIFAMYVNIVYIKYYNPS